MTKENLVNFKDRTESEARELGKKGGVASGKARRAKRAFKENFKSALEMLTEMEVEKLQTDEAKAIMEETGFMGYQLINLMKSKKDMVRFNAIKEGLAVAGLKEPEKIIQETRTKYVDKETNKAYNKHIDDVISKSRPKKKKK